MHKQVPNSANCSGGFRDSGLYVLLRDGIPWGMEAFFSLPGNPARDLLYFVCQILCDAQTGSLRHGFLLGSYLFFSTFMLWHDLTMYLSSQEGC